MVVKKYKVYLTNDEREQLYQIISRGKAKAKKLTHAHVLLKADESPDGGPAWKDEQTIVMDNLNTHRAASLYAAFTPQEARRLLDRFEFHYTPKHGSWLNMAEMEFSVLSRKCLDRRIPNRETLRQKVTTWENTRNAKSAKADWRFTVDDARIKLKKLYPVIPN